MEGLGFFDNKKHQAILLIMLMASAFYLTYYFRAVLGTGTLFTHFFYIPIVLSCCWWRRKGLLVTVLLILILMLGQKIYGDYENSTDDYLRALMLLLTSLIVVALSEALARLRNNLHQSEEKYRTIFENTGNATIIIEKDMTIALANSEFEKLWGFAKEEVENKKKWTEFVAEEDLEKMKGYHELRRINPENAPRNYEFRFLTRENVEKDIMATIDMIPGTDKSVASFLDVTQLKKSLQLEKDLQEKLSDALAKVLSGMIPICASCKKIKDQKKQWVQVETYIREKTRANFSHSICPDCAKELYSGFLSEKELEKIYVKSA